MARAKTKKTAAKAKRKPLAKRTQAKARPARKPTKRPAAKAARGGAKTAAPGSAMRALAQRIIDATLADDDEAMLAFYAPDVESSEASGAAEVGVEALRAKFAGWRAMVTDTSFEPRRVVVDGNVIVIEWLGRVTLRASGRQAELHEVAVHEIRDGKIVREAFFYNPAALAPEPAAL
jgi:ketosteroid isomerase-like protein